MESDANSNTHTQRGEWPAASWKRKLLAVYVDFLIFSTAFGIGVHAITSSELPRFVQYAAFALLEVFLLSVCKKSVGYWFLSISRFTSEAPTGPEGSKEDTGKTLHWVVDPVIFGRESWLTMLLAVLFVLDGTKSMVRWTTFGIPEPWFGFQPGHEIHAAISIMTGALLVYVGYGCFALKRVGLWIGISVMVVVFSSILASWQLWDDYARETVIARQEHFGLPVDERKIQFMQAIVPEGLLGYTTVIVVALASVRRRFA